MDWAEGADTLNRQNGRFNVYLGHGFRGADTLNLADRPFNV